MGGCGVRSDTHTRPRAEEEAGGGRGGGDAQRRPRDELMVSVDPVVTDPHHQHKHRTSVELVQLQVVQLQPTSTRLSTRSDTHSRAQHLS